MMQVDGCKIVPSDRADLFAGAGADIYCYNRLYPHNVLMREADTAGR